MAAAFAWAPVCSARTAMLCNQVISGAVTCVICCADGPSQSAVTVVSTPLYPAAAVNSSPASPSQAAAAASNGPAPAPRYMRVELISGGNAPKSTIAVPALPDRGRVGGLGARIGAGIGPQG